MIISKYPSCNPHDAGRELISCCPSVRTCGYLSGKSLVGCLRKDGQKMEKKKRKLPKNLEIIDDRHVV